MQIGSCTTGWEKMKSHRDTPSCNPHSIYPKTAPIFPKPSAAYLWNRVPWLVSQEKLVIKMEGSENRSFHYYFLKKMWSMPAIVTTGRVFHHQPPSLWTFLVAGFEPGISGVYLVRSSPKLGALTTRSSCCPKNLVYASHSNDGTCFSSPTA